VLLTHIALGIGRKHGAVYEEISLLYESAASRTGKSLGGAGITKSSASRTRIHFLSEFLDGRGRTTFRFDGRVSPWTIQLTGTGEAEHIRGRWFQRFFDRFGVKLSGAHSTPKKDRPGWHP